jgi:hypothetical protein
MAGGFCGGFLRYGKLRSRGLNVKDVAADILKPFRPDRVLAEEKRCELDLLYQRISDDLRALLGAVALRAAP